VFHSFSTATQSNCRDLSVISVSNMVLYWLHIEYLHHYCKEGEKREKCFHWSEVMLKYLLSLIHGHLFYSYYHFLKNIIA